MFVPIEFALVLQSKEQVKDVSICAWMFNINFQCIEEQGSTEDWLGLFNLGAIDKP